MPDTNLREWAIRARHQLVYALTCDEITALEKAGESLVRRCAEIAYHNGGQYGWRIKAKNAILNAYGLSDER